MDEADVEHAGAKTLITELEAMKPGDDHYDAKVTASASCGVNRSCFPSEDNLSYRSRCCGSD